MDKASANFPFVCQKLYALFFIKELGLHVLQCTNNNQVISDHAIFIRNEFNLEIEEKNKKLPSIYWIRRLHKHPSKVRFIIAAPPCSVKPLSKAFTLVFKLSYG